MKVIVYTAIFGEIDVLWPPSPLAMDGSEYICFTDKPRRECGYWSQRLTEEWPTIEKESARYSAIRPLWDVRIVRKKFKSSRKTARWYKALAHQHFPKADITIWLDGNVRLLIPASQAIRRWLGDAEFATFDHQDRRCLYREADFCAAKGKGSRAKLAAQKRVYRQAGMPDGWGLPETKCVIRHNTARVQELNLAWWKQLSEHSIRDQVSLPYVCWKLGTRWKVIPGRAGLPTFPGERNMAFWYARHRKKHA